MIECQITGQIFPDEPEMVPMEKVKVLIDALQEIDECWCQHPKIRLTSNEYLDRDWCSDCSEWIFRGKEENPAKLALAKFYLKPEVVMK